MGADLYHESIVAHARAATRAGRLAAPDASITLDNPLCGDRVTIDIKLADERITDVAHRVRGCLLCEASASVVGAGAVGKPVAALVAAEADVRRMLEGRATPGTLWPGFDAFAPASGYKSRHGCVLLPLEALLEAVRAAARGARQ